VGFGVFVCLNRLGKTLRPETVVSEARDAERFLESTKKSGRTIHGSRRSSRTRWDCQWDARPPPRVCARSGTRIFFFFLRCTAKSISGKHLAGSITFRRAPLLRNHVNFDFKTGIYLI
jgi:hypothetical protein